MVTEQHNLSQWIHRADLGGGGPGGPWTPRTPLGLERLEKEECDRNKVAQTLCSEAITHTTPSSSQFNRQLNAGSLVQPSLLIGIGSKVQVSDAPRYGVLRWIWELPDMKGAIAGVQMVSLPLQFPNSAHVLIYMWFACAVQEEPMKGCGDGSWKETQ